MVVSEPRNDIQLIGEPTAAYLQETVPILWPSALLAVGCSVRGGCGRGSHAEYQLEQRGKGYAEFKKPQSSIAPQNVWIIGK